MSNYCWNYNNFSWGTLTSTITSGNHINVHFNKGIDLTWTIEDSLFCYFILVWNISAILQCTVACSVIRNLSISANAKKMISVYLKTRANLKKLSAYSGSATSVYPKIDLTLRAFQKTIFWLTCVIRFTFSILRGIA